MATNWPCAGQAGGHTVGSGAVLIGHGLPAGTDGHRRARVTTVLRTAPSSEGPHVFTALRSRSLAGAAAVVAGVGLAAAATGPAQAADPCPYPYVCFANWNSMGTAYSVVAKYKVLTPGYFQNVSQAAYSADLVINTRHDDIATIQFESPSSEWCIAPGQSRSLNQYPNSTEVKGIKIENPSICP
jgi:hypothetical protein